MQKVLVTWLSNTSVLIVDSLCKELLNFSGICYSCRTNIVTAVYQIAFFFGTPKRQGLTCMFFACCVFPSWTQNGNLHSISCLQKRWLLTLCGVNSLCHFSHVKHSWAPPLQQGKSTATGFTTQQQHVTQAPLKWCKWLCWFPEMRWYAFFVVQKDGSSTRTTDMNENVPV